MPRSRAGAADHAASAIAILGPTASGKSSLALELAGDLVLEIISVDSAQVYRGLDVGTAKPTAAERERVPHHLIDILDPAQAYSAARFVQDADASIAAVRERHRLPLLVGGTMLYAKALREGLAPLPSADPALREQLARQAAQQGWPALHERLRALDPDTAARLEPGDSQRIQRALEVVELTGTPMSQLLREQPVRRLRLHTIALLPVDRARLHERIEHRFDRMLAAGFVEEVRGLRARADLHADLPSMRSVGYRQAWEHLEQATGLAAFRAAAIAASRQLAKRQITWLRSIPDADVLDPFAADTPRRLRALIKARMDQVIS
jgi:tRNA dimethylallyltransferase